MKEILDKSFTASAKIYRICKRFTPKDFAPTQQFLDNDWEVKRTEILKRRMAFCLLNKDLALFMGSWAAVKRSPEVYCLGNVKSYLHKRVNE